LNCVRIQSNKTGLTGKDIGSGTFGFEKIEET
jgi:hypothetical protein